MANLTLFKVESVEVLKPTDLGRGRLVTTIVIQSADGRHEISLHSDKPLEVRAPHAEAAPASENECVVEGVRYRAVAATALCEGCDVFGSIRRCQLAGDCEPSARPIGHDRIIWKRADA